MHARTALLLFVALAVLHTWPIGAAPWRESLNHSADAEASAWMLSWIAHALPRDPLHLFDANIFAPERRTLTYADPLIVPALAVAPVWWLSGSPVLTFNLSMVAGLALTAWATWFAARRWTGSDQAALIAGALAAFNPHLLTRLPHVAASWMWTVPVSLYLSDRLIDEPRPRTAWWLAITVAATAATSLYTLAFVGIVTGVAITISLVRREWRAAFWIAAAAMGGLVLALPVLLPYAHFAAAGVYRSIESIALFSATPAGYLHSASRLHGGWSAPFFDRDVSVFFAGFTALALAAAGCASWRALRAGRQVALLVVLAAGGIVLSLGPATPVYEWLYEWVPPLRGLRAAARFGYLYLVAVAMAAAIGTAAIAGRTPARWRLAVTGALLALVTAEAWSAPILTRPFTGVPAIYTRLREVPGPVLLAEMPFWPPEAFFENGEYVINSTAHWRPLMNGYSGHMPQSYRDRAEAFWYFPEPRALDRLGPEGVTHVMVHLERWPAHERPGVERTLRDQQALTLVASDARGHRLYRVR